MAAAAPPAVPPPPEVGMASGIMVDANVGRILWSRDADAERAPASLTKIMTALVVLERVPLDDEVAISAEARAAPGSRIYAEEGWKMPVEDLLWGLLLHSGNDAAVALAEKASPDGTVAGFVDLMNRRARELGATHTHFMNPHGMDASGHMTTARDLALISLAAMRSPVFAEMVASRTHTIPWPSGPRLLVNHNKLLARYEGAIGIKTGFTDDAGQSLAAAAGRGGHTLISIVLGSTPAGLYTEPSSLFDWGFANLDALRAAAPESVVPAPARTSARVAGAGELSYKGLRIVQVDLSDLAQSNRVVSPASAPAAAPLMALGAAVAAAFAVRRRRIVRREASSLR